MNVYKIKNSAILHDAVRYKIGETIILSAENAAQLTAFLEFVAPLEEGANKPAASLENENATLENSGEVQGLDQINENLPASANAENDNSENSGDDDHVDDSEHVMGEALTDEIYDAIQDAWTVKAIKSVLDENQIEYAPRAAKRELMELAYPIISLVADALME